MHPLTERRYNLIFRTKSLNKNKNILKDFLLLNIVQSEVENIKNALTDIENSNKILYLISKILVDLNLRIHTSDRVYLKYHTSNNDLFYSGIYICYLENIYDQTLFCPLKISYLCIQKIRDIRTF